MRIPLTTVFATLMALPPALAGPLTDAARNGDLSEIETLLAAGADVNEDGALAPLHAAAMRGHADAVGLLLSQGADPEAQSSMLGTPLHAAARFGNVEVVQELLAAGSDPDARDKDDFTPLMRAIVEQRETVIPVLLSAGADVNLVGMAPGGALGTGPTIALHLARERDNQTITDHLLAAGAGPVPPEVPADLATGGDPVAGRDIAYGYCGEACHSLEPKDPPRTARYAGPPLVGLVGRPVASVAGFDYSEALIEHGGTWTPERLYSFAAGPMLTVPGTRMHETLRITPDMTSDIVAYFFSVAP